MDEFQITSAFLAQITQIKWILSGILIIIALGLAGIILIIVLAKKTTDQESNLNSFKSKASALLDKDDLDGVIELSQAKIEKYPKEMYAHWYLAQAYYRKKEYRKALEELNTISENSPSWREHYVDPYVDEIKEKLRESKPELVEKE